MKLDTPAACNGPITVGSYVESISGAYIGILIGSMLTYFLVTSCLILTGPVNFCVTGLGVTGLGVTGLGVTGLGVTGLGVTGLGVTGLGVTGLGVTGLGVTGLGVTGLGVTGLPATGAVIPITPGTEAGFREASPVPPALPVWYPYMSAFTWSLVGSGVTVFPAFF
jgi:hypothetical protein